MLNLRNIEILLTVMSHFDVMSVNILVYSFLVLRNVRQNLTLLGLWYYATIRTPNSRFHGNLRTCPRTLLRYECIKCTLGGITSAEPHNFRGLAPSVKAARYFSCYTTSVTLQSTPNARSAEGKASPPSAPAVVRTYRRLESRRLIFPIFFKS